MFIAYSTASSSILGHADTIQEARAFGGQTDEFIVVLECPKSEAEKLNSWDLPRKNMPIVWRGENSNAKNFRK